jgi:hypothetical protein
LAISQQDQFPLGDHIVADAEKRRVKVDKVYALRFHAFEDFEIIAEDEFIDWHK